MPFARAAIPCTIHRLGIVEYGPAMALQRDLVQACREDDTARLVLLQHPPTYTLGARGRTPHVLLDDEALARLGASVQRTDRGGDVTFHGPGQLVAYPILDLSQWRQGPRWYVRSLEEVVIDVLARFGVAAGRSQGRPGVWIDESKIAAIGVRISRGVTSHGFALNVDPDLHFFNHIVPCGLAGTSVTSMKAQLGEAPRMEDVMDAVVTSFERIFHLRVATARSPLTAEAAYA